MKRLSFRSIITVTLILVIATFSFLAFHIFSHHLEKKIYAESEKNISSTNSGLDLLKDQIYYTIDEHDGKIISTLLQRMEDKEQVLNAYLFDDRGLQKYILNEDLNKKHPVSRSELNDKTKDVSLKSFPSAEQPFIRAYMPMINTESCHACHVSDKETLGYIVIDLSMNPAGEINRYIRKWSLIFTFVMVGVIIAFVIFMHYRFVRKSIREFKNTINKVNQGNLDKRLSIPETKELGQLGIDFNSMLDTFQNTQTELKDFHKKELRINYKLATIGEMSARLAHEIRNPVTGIANAIEIIVKESPDKENTPIFEEIQRQANRVNDAISDLLKYSKKRDPNLIRNDINEIIGQMVFFLKKQLKNDEIEIFKNLQDDIPLFKFDNEQIEDVLMNLGLNAIQALEGKGTITFKTAFLASEKRIQIMVSDTGKGIPKEDLSKVFHPFFTTRNEGTGLGLSIVKDIIDKHGGEIWVESEEKRGTTFTISLPV